MNNILVYLLVFIACTLVGYSVGETGLGVLAGIVIDILIALSD